MTKNQIKQKAAEYGFTVRYKGDTGTYFFEQFLDNADTKGMERFVESNKINAVTKTYSKV